jgi:hypothetical protein
VNLDVSVAPEIAQLIEPGPDGHPSAPAPGLPGDGADRGGAVVPTVGRLARQLRLITAAPERWWGLVRFDPGRPVRVSIAAGPWYETWLMIIPPSGPGAWAGAGAECGCHVVTVVAGQVTEQAAGADGPAAAPLRSGRVRVHAPGQPHRLVNLSGGYAVTMHARA